MSKLRVDRLVKKVGRLVSEGYRSEAIDLCEAHCRKYGVDAAVVSMLGLLQAKEKNFEGAIKSLMSAFKLSPADPGISYNLAKCFVEAGLYEDAEKYYRLAIDNAPQFVAAYFNLANMLRNNGDFNEAINLYRQAIALDPSYSKSFYALSLSKKFLAGDPDLDVMEKTRFGRRLSEQQQVYLLFAMSKAYDDMGDYDRAFEALAAANRLKRSEYIYSVDEHKRLFENIKRVCDKGLMQRLSGCGVASSRPVFIVGMPRSGTTLVEQIVSSHPAVYGVGEIDDLEEVLLAAVAAASSAGFPDAILALSCNGVTAAAEAYDTRLAAYADSSRYVVNKMPGNFMHVGMIRLMFPEAIIFHCRRDPVDTCFSIYRQYFSGQHQYAYDLEELGAYYRLYEDLMSYWQELFPGLIHDVSYEALVSDQEGETRRLIDLLGLSWDDACLDFQNNERAVKTVSVAQVREPIYSRSISGWLRYESHLEPLCKALKG